MTQVSHGYTSEHSDREPPASVTCRGDRSPSSCDRPSRDRPPAPPRCQKSPLRARAGVYPRRLAEEMICGGARHKFSKNPRQEQGRAWQREEETKTPERFSSILLTMAVNFEDPLPCKHSDPGDALQRAAEPAFDLSNKALTLETKSSLQWFYPTLLPHGAKMLGILFGGRYIFYNLPQFSVLD